MQIISLRRDKERRSFCFSSLQIIGLSTSTLKSSASSINCIVDHVIAPLYYQKFSVTMQIISLRRDTERILLLFIFANHWSVHHIHLVSFALHKLLHIHLGRHHYNIFFNKFFLCFLKICILHCTALHTAVKNINRRLL